MIPERVAPPGRPACQRCELLLSHEVRRLRWWRTRRSWSCTYTRVIAQRELSEPVTILREATPAVFRFGGNHSPRGVKLRQVDPIAFDSDSVPSEALLRGAQGIGVTRSAVVVEGLHSGRKARECGGMSPTPSLAEVRSRP